MRIKRKDDPHMSGQNPKANPCLFFGHTIPLNLITTNNVILPAYCMSVRGCVEAPLFDVRVVPLRRKHTLNMSIL